MTSEQYVAVTHIIWRGQSSVQTLAICAPTTKDAADKIATDAMQIAEKMTQEDGEGWLLAGAMLIDLSATCAISFGFRTHHRDASNLRWA